MTEEELLLNEEIKQIMLDHKNKEDMEVNEDEFQSWMDGLVEQTDKFDYLEGITYETIQQEIHELLDSLNIEDEKRQKYKENLKLYRYVKNICDLHTNGQIRRMTREEPHQLKPPATFTGLIFSSVNTLVKFRIRRNAYNYSMDRFYTFQKLSAEECMIMHANDYSVND